MPKDLGLNPTGPLPLGWHRVVWTNSSTAGEQYVHTDNVVSAALLVAALAASPNVAPNSVKAEGWSDFPSFRDCEINHPGAPCPG